MRMTDVILFVWGKAKRIIKIENSKLKNVF